MGCLPTLVSGHSGQENTNTRMLRTLNQPVDESHHHDGANSAIHETNPDNDGESETSRDDRSKMKSADAVATMVTIRENNSTSGKQVGKLVSRARQAVTTMPSMMQLAVSLCPFASDNSAVCGPRGHDIELQTLRHFHGVAMFIEKAAANRPSSEIDEAFWLQTGGLPEDADHHDDIEATILHP
ncbi:hypothetical protein BKA93DRAFT_824204 [Sparassis latifolia]